MKKFILIAASLLAGFTSFAQPKFAHVSFTELIQLMPEADQARATMAAASQEAQETYQAMVEEFNTKYTTYQQKAATWQAATREMKEKELTEIQQRIQEFGQSVEQELAAQQQQLFAPIQQKAMEVVEKLAKEGGYVYVIDKTTVLYLDPAQSTDLTPAARKELGIAEDRTLESLQEELAAKQQAAQGLAQ